MESRSTCAPNRRIGGVSLWILSSWVDGRVQQKQELLSSLEMAE